MEVKIKGIYKHFKGDYYIVEDIAIDSDNMNKIVVYRGLYEDSPLWARDYNDFVSEVDHEKHPDIKQKYRFELQTITSKNKH